MRRVDGVVGNADADPDLADAIAAHRRAGTLETVVLDDTQRKRSRFRTTTESGTDLGVLVDRPELSPDDVLVLDDDLAVVVAFERREAFVVDLPSETETGTAIELGHRIGNQHWDVAIDDGTLYVPREADRSIIEETLGPYLPEGATIRYETVDAELFVDGEGGPGLGHSHGAGGGGHDHAGGQTHAHGASGHTHANHDHTEHGHSDHTQEHGGDGK
jgi:urease accessory protein